MNYDRNKEEAGGDSRVRIQEYCFCSKRYKKRCDNLFWCTAASTIVVFFWHVPHRIVHSSAVGDGQ